MEISMPSFLFDIGEKDRAVGRFIGHVRSELQRAFAREKANRKLTQQAVATSLGVNRSVINRQLTGYENMTIKSVAELTWAIGWVPNFSLEEIEATSGNFFIPAVQSLLSEAQTPTSVRTPTATENTSFLLAAE